MKKIIEIPEYPPYELGEEVTEWLVQNNVLERVDEMTVVRSKHGYLLIEFVPEDEAYEDK